MRASTSPALLCLARADWWYWLVDPQLRTFEVLELGADGRYVHAVAATSERISVPGLDDFELVLSDLWRRVDELESQADE